MYVDSSAVFNFILFSRLDSTLVDFNDMRWERGDVTFIFDGEAQPHDALTVLDNKLKVYQRIRYEVNLDNKKYIHVHCMYTCTELQIRKGNRGNLGSQCMFSLRFCCCCCCFVVLRPR